MATLRMYYFLSLWAKHLTLWPKAVLYQKKKSFLPKEHDKNKFLENCCTMVQEINTQRYWWFYWGHKLKLPQFIFMSKLPSQIYFHLVVEFYYSVEFWHLNCEKTNKKRFICPQCHSHTYLTKPLDKHFLSLDLRTNQFF